VATNHFARFAVSAMRGSFKQTSCQSDEVSFFGTNEHTNRGEWKMQLMIENEPVGCFSKEQKNTASHFIRSRGVLVLREGYYAGLQFQSSSVKSFWTRRKF
jgi:hypothetical protein